MVRTLSRQLRERFETLRLRTRLLVGFAVLIVLTLLADSVSGLSHERVQRAFETFLRSDNRIAELTDDARAGLLRARRNEKDFLLRVRDFGYEETRSRYLTMLQNELTGVREVMAQVRQLAHDEDVVTEAQAVMAATQAYEQGFTRVVGLYGRLGHRDAGLEGRFTADARLLEEQLRAPASLRVALLELRRLEKNYLLRGLQSDAQAFQHGAAGLDQALAQVALDKPRSQALRAVLQTYTRAFSDYVAVREAIDEAQQQYLAAVHEVEPLLDRLDLRAEAAKVATQATLQGIRHTTQWTVVLTGLGAMLLGLTVVLLLGRHIDGALRSCMNFAGRLAAGELGARLQQPPGPEFGALAFSLNRMADALQRAQVQQAEQSSELLRLNRALRVLSLCNEALVRTDGEAELVQRICCHLVDAGGYRLAWVGYARHDAARSIEPVAMAGIDKAYVEQLQLSWGDDAQRHGIAGAAVRDARVVVVGDIAADPRLAPWREAALARGLVSCIALPLLGRGAMLGALCIYAPEVDAFDAAEIKVLTELADDLSYGIASLREAQERRQFQRQLEHQAAFDQLTGLANRFTLEARLQQCMADARRHDQRLALLCVDLDRFKLVNETLGHASGDELLRALAQRLRGAVRECDTVARLGSDEFVVLLKDIHGAAQAGAVAADVLETLGAPQAIAGCELRPSASVGVSLFPEDGTDMATLLRSADTAMAHAKSLGGGRLHFFAPEMNARVAARFAMEADLRRALEREELLVHYQPQVCLRSGAVIGAEALVRWRHPQQGMVSPADFIPLAEETGLIEPLGEWILKAVCRQQRAWLDQGLAVVPVAVNLSARQFHHPDLVGLVQQALRANALQPRLLGLEITESAAMKDVESAIATVRALRALGVVLSLDDFGTGYSSLSHLKRFPIDHLKIDRSFVNDITSDPDDAAICNAVIGLAHSLGLRVIAEGVETPAQMQYLRRQGCDELQGYLFSRPLPAPEYERLLADGRRLALPAPVSAAPGATTMLADAA